MAVGLMPSGLARGLETPGPDLSNAFRQSSSFKKATMSA
jgi:hypothetical protein